MVLKKSNSSLNSGATQRVRAKEVARQAQLRATCTPEYCLVLAPGENSTSTPSPADDKLYTRRRAQAMSTGQCMVLDYFNRDVAMLNDHGMAVQAWFGQTRHDGHAFPVHKDVADTFPAAVNRLKKDADFARDLSQFVDLQIHTFSGQPLVPESRIQRSKWSSFDLAITASSSPVRETCKKNHPSAQLTNRGRRTKTAKARGVQRQSQIMKPRMSQHPEESLPRPEWVLYAEVSYPDQRGARGASVNPFAKRGAVSSQPVVSKHTSKKVKSREDNDAITHGISVDFEVWRGQHEICADLQACHDYCDDEHESALELHADFDESSQTNDRPSSVFNILDFCQKTPLKTLKRRRRKSSVQGSQDAVDLESAASSTKRSFIVYDACNDNLHPPKDENETEINHSEGEDKTYTYTREPSLPFSGKAPTQQRIDKVFRYFDPSLISVRLTNCQPHIERSDVYEKNGYSVEFGNCSPACFELHFEDTRELWISKYTILGRELNDHWLLSLMDTTTQKGRCFQKLNDHLKTSLDSCQEFADLPGLVHFVRRFFSRVEPICLEGTAKKAKIGQVGSPNNLFKDPVDYSICTPEKAFKVLSSRPNFILMENAGSEQADSPSPDECCVCYLASDDLQVHNTLVKIQPCSHTFCLMCWRQHVYHSLRDGRVDTGCLVGHCKTQVNAVMMQSLLPNFMMQRWWRLFRDKQLELSPASAWCSKCGKVVVLEDDASDGCPVSCGCGTRFCHSCGEQPHWPASCAQFRAYLDSPIGESVSQLAIVPLKEIVVRPCPNCRYPIQKNGGCDNMYCSMCRHCFSWGETKDVKRRVFNETIILSKDEAILCFMNCGKAQGALVDMAHPDVQIWLYGLPTLDVETLGMPAGMNVHEKLKIRQTISEQVMSIMQFITLAVSVIEGAYLYLGMSQHVFQHTPSKFVEVKHVDRILVRLTEVVYKLKAKVVGRDFRMLYKSRACHDYLLEIGKTKLLQVVQQMKKWERLPDHDIDLSWLNDIKLGNFVRYK